MTELLCSDCETTFETDSLDEVAVDPRTAEVLCEDCREVHCVACDRWLDVDELTTDHIHETGGFVCDTCPTYELPYDFTVRLKRSDEGYVPSHINDIYPEISLEDPYNGDAIPHQLWNLSVDVTFRLTESGQVRPVGINGELLEKEAQ